MIPVETSPDPKANPCWCCNNPSESRHHLKPFRYGGSGKEENLIDLCNDCHTIVDCSDQPNKAMLERILEFPRIQLLMNVRTMADVAATRKHLCTKREVANWALKAISEPNNLTVRRKLEGAVEQLDIQLGRNEKKRKRRVKKRPVS